MLGIYLNPHTGYHGHRFRIAIKPLVVIVNVPRFREPLAGLHLSRTKHNNLNRHEGRRDGVSDQIFRRRGIPNVNNRFGPVEGNEKLCRLVIRAAPPEVTTFRQFGDLPFPGEDREFFQIRFDFPLKRK